MNRGLLAILVGTGLAAPAWAVLAPGPSTGPRYREGEVLLNYRGAANGKAAVALKSAYGTTPRINVLEGCMELVQLPSVTDVRGALAALRSESEVEYAEPNFIRYERAQMLPGTKS